MKYRRTQDFVTLILTAVLQPRCALCDQIRRLPDRLCSACKVSVDNARRLQRTAQDKGPAPAGSHTKICSSKTLGGAIEPLSNTKSLGALDARVSVFNYQRAIADLITRWKYHGMIELTGYIADLIYADCPPIPAHDMVTVIPSHWQRAKTLKRPRPGLAFGACSYKTQCHREPCIFAKTKAAPAISTLKTV